MLVRFGDSYLLNISAAFHPSRCNIYTSQNFEGEKMKKLVGFIGIATFMLGCANIEHTSRVDQPLGQTRMAGVGDVVLRINKTRDLQNAFGKADLFGRKTNEGFVEVRFVGVEANGEIVLFRKDIQILTNETTTSRTPFSSTVGSSSTTATGTYSGTTNAGVINANSRSNYAATTIAPVSDFHIIAPPDTFAIRLPKVAKTVPIEGHIVEIINSSATSLNFKIVRMP